MEPKDGREVEEEGAPSEGVQWRTVRSTRRIGSGQKGTLFLAVPSKSGPENEGAGQAEGGSRGAAGKQGESDRRARATGGEATIGALFFSRSLAARRSVEPAAERSLAPRHLCRNRASDGDAARPTTIDDPGDVRTGGSQPGELSPAPGRVRAECPGDGVARRVTKTMFSAPERRLPANLPAAAAG